MFSSDPHFPSLDALTSLLGVVGSGYKFLSAVRGYLLFLWEAETAGIKAWFRKSQKSSTRVASKLAWMGQGVKTKWMH